MIWAESVVHEVTYPHPPERVWRALVDSRELALWLMPNDFVPRKGHQFTLACDDHGVVEAEVLDIDPPRLLRCRWTGTFGDTVVTFQLTPTGSGTRLRLEHRGWVESQQTDRDGFDAGWTTYLTDNLAALLAAGGAPSTHESAPKAERT